MDTFSSGVVPVLALSQSFFSRWVGIEIEIEIEMEVWWWWWWWEMIEIGVMEGLDVMRLQLMKKLLRDV